MNREDEKTLPGQSPKTGGNMKPLALALLLFVAGCCENPTEPQRPSLDGKWTGMLNVTPVTLTISGNAGIMHFHSINVPEWELGAVIVSVAPVRIRLSQDGFEGTISEDWNTISGTYSSYGKDFSLILRRAGH